MHYYYTCFRCSVIIFLAMLWKKYFGSHVFPSSHPLVLCNNGSVTRADLRKNALLLYLLSLFRYPFPAHAEGEVFWQTFFLLPLILQCCVIIHGSVTRTDDTN